MRNEGPVIPLNRLVLEEGSVLPLEPAGPMLIRRGARTSIAPEEGAPERCSRRGPTAGPATSCNCG